MKFFQKDDGSCELYFAEQEIDIIKKHKKLIFEPKFFKSASRLSKALFNLSSLVPLKPKPLDKSSKCFL